MAYRGRGRGRGRGGYGGGGGYAKQEPFVPFPEIELPDRKTVPDERKMIVGKLLFWNSKLLDYWKSSPYYLEETVEKKRQSMDIERYSDWNKPKTMFDRGSVDQFLLHRSSNFPAELVKDPRELRNPKRVRWNADAGLQKLDLFEKLEKKYEGQEGKDEKEKKEGEDEDEEDDEAGGEVEEEYSDDGDYNQNRDFDDDEDDFNMDDGNDDEATY